MRKMIFKIKCACSLFVLILFWTTAVSAQTTEFVYQGQLQNASAAANGSFDFEFLIFDSLSGGSQVGTTLTRSNLAVANGSFSAKLDFGPNFPGAARFIEIHVRQSGGGSFTFLSPRQAISNAPYAIKSLTADTATTAANAANSASADTLSPACVSCVTGARIAGGQVVKSLNGLSDNVTLTAGANVTLVPSGNTLTINAPGGTSGNNWSLTGNTGSTPATNFLGTTDNQPMGFRINGAEVMRMITGGNIGIGTPTPGFRLDVADRMRVRQAGGNTAGIWFYQTTPANDRAFVGMVDDSHVGFYGNSGAGFGLTMNTTNGGVGIGTTDVSQFVKLDVAGGNFTHAVRGTSFLGIGVWGSSGGGSGVYGDGGANGFGVQGISSGNGTGVQGVSTTGTGVQGSSTNGTGVRGLSTSGTGVYGAANATTGTMPGVYGETKSADTAGIGVFGLSGNGRGVQGNSTTGSGVYGYSSTGTALYGASDNGTGVIGTGKFGISGFGHSGGYGGYFNNVAPGEIALFVEGTGRVNVLQVAGGSDMAEKFSVAPEAKPGLVVVIDPDHPGQLSIARGAYDRRVAGVISGANKLEAGMVLSDLPGSKNSLPVALSGRVWVYCDAARSAIRPGDLLTTSNTPGHAMKAVNMAKARGATLGKAMTSLKSGRGFVLVLVTLQ